MMRRRVNARENGIAVLLVAVLMLFTIPIVGLAIDAGLLFVVKGRLSAAADAAALAAGRSLNLGNDLATVQAAATSAATRFFDANFPPGHLNTSTTGRTITPHFNQGVDGNGLPNGILTITVDASVDSPTYFMRLLGRDAVTVAATGSATRRNLVMMILLDVSGSMGARVTTGVPSTLPSNATSCDVMVQAAATFVDNFSPYDSVGLAVFSYSGLLKYAPSSNFKNAGSTGIKYQIGLLDCTGGTNATAGLELSYQQLVSAGQQLSVNSLVFFSDGVPNIITANFPIRTSVDDRIGPGKTYGSLPSDNRMKYRDARNVGSPAMWLKDTTVPSGNYNNCQLNYANDTTQVCYKMPLPSLNTTPATVFGGIAYTGGCQAISGGRWGLAVPFTGMTAGSFPSGFATSSSPDAMTSQSFAYIPDADWLGNSTHGPKDSRVFGVNQQCAPASVTITSGNSRCKYIGDNWSAYPSLSVGSNFFTSGAYSGKFRSDHTNAIAVTAMNSAINEANKIRSNTTYNIRIATIALQGNGSDPIDREFMPIVANLDQIPPLIYEPVGTASYANPYYVSSQQKGMHGATANNIELQRIFQEIASALLRLSN